MARWSMPSKRPQTIRGPGPAASSAPRAGGKGPPRGLLGSRARAEATSAASMAAASTSARNTMPGPPPAGVSSTLRWRSVAEARISRASNAHNPDASALPARLTPSGPGNISGNRVRTVARQIVALEVMPSNGASGRSRQPETWPRLANGCSAARADGVASSRSTRLARRLAALRLATIVNQFEGGAGLQVLVGPRNKGAFDPMIDRRCIPGHRSDLVFHGRVIDVHCGKYGFDLERIEGTDLGGDAFLF